MNPKKRRLIALSIGLLIGIIWSIHSTGTGTDAGIILPLVIFWYSLLTVIFTMSLEEVIYGKASARNIAGVVLVLLGLYVAYVAYSKSHETHYCDGLPVSQYTQVKGVLPADCRY